MITEVKTFFNLSQIELFSIYYLRSEVFVVEQNCAYQDVDEKDLKSLHVMIKNDEDLIAYCRILPPGVSYAETAIGRVVVPMNYRKKGIAKQLLLWTIDYCNKTFSKTDIVISAQTYLIKFYTDLGFKTEAESYLEDNIPHIKMRLKFKV